ncbi:MAG: hypothetical protein E7302_10350 [Butyrivibrio sp.]|nr:hypothetical protein [Butyrivibrio sp.]
MGYNNNNAGMHTLVNLPLEYLADEKKSKKKNSDNEMTVIKWHVNESESLIDEIHLDRVSIVPTNVYLKSLQDKLNIMEIFQDVSRKTVTVFGKPIVSLRGSFSEIEKITVFLSIISEETGIRFEKIISDLSRIGNYSAESIEKYIYTLASEMTISEMIKKMQYISRKDYRTKYEFKGIAQLSTDIARMMMYLSLLSEKIGMTIEDLFIPADPDKCKVVAYEQIEKNYLRPYSFDEGFIDRRTKKAEFICDRYDKIYLDVNYDEHFPYFCSMDMMVTKTKYKGSRRYHYEMIYTGYNDRCGFMPSGVVIYEEVSGLVKELVEETIEMRPEWKLTSKLVER